MTNKSKKKGRVKAPDLTTLETPEQLIDEAVQISLQAQADLDAFEHVIRVELDEEVTAKDGTETRALIFDTRPDGFFTLFNRFGNPVEYLAPDSTELKEYQDALASGDVDWLLNTPYQYNEMGYRVHTGHMAVYKAAMSNIKLTEANLEKMGQAAISAMEGQALNFFYLNRVSGLKNLLEPNGAKSSIQKQTEINSL